MFNIAQIIVIGSCTNEINVLFFIKFVGSEQYEIMTKNWRQLKALEIGFSIVSVFCEKPQQNWLHKSNKGRQKSADFTKSGIYETKIAHKKF